MEARKKKKRLAILGATGSIGRSALDVVRGRPGDFEVVLLSAKSRAAELTKLGKPFPGARLVLADELLPAIGKAEAEITVNGIAGAAGLAPSLACLKARSALALANKETVVMAYPLVKALAEAEGVPIIPVDSEHAAIFKLLKAHGSETAEIILTASGGPFRGYSREQLKGVTAADALAHPTWNMGPKITLDSATMANKALEVIEAVRLFDMKPEQVKVVVHPQSVVHSLIRTAGGVLYAQLSRPDMRLPIQEALYWPEAAPASFDPLDLPGLRLDFEEPDGERFPLLPLGYEAARRGGLYPCAFNGANEAAAAAFFQGRLGFLDIPDLVRYVLDQNWEGPMDIESVMETDRRSREIAAVRIRK
ncbi:MAG: 1-deoxy-D-xylulose-5-phosphate reductoisomerase [Treponema sp.]|jgi:1-deoxy-D-xylulose-5-phosphate reductoisomerase|nr:1-deoxy-D-xylulose-5-phosphate reductoisomerase [Treponema sp.]